LPNILYLGGGAEIEYWLPLQDSFNLLNLPFPALAMRDSVIQIPNKSAELIDSFGFNYEFLLENEKIIINEYLKSNNLNNQKLSDKISSLQNGLKEIENQTQRNEINSGIIYKEIHQVEKAILKLAKLIEDEELKKQKQNVKLSRLLKIKEKFFDKKQEREEFYIEKPNEFQSNFINLTIYKPILCVNMAL